MKALVVFHDHGAGFGHRLMRRGFRHCLVAVADGPYWIEIDGLAGMPKITVKAGTDFDLAAFYRDLGWTVVETEQRTCGPVGPFTLANCVGLVKAVLALRAPFAPTPYALYRRLIP